LYKKEIFNAAELNPFALYVVTAFKFNPDAEMPNLPVRNPKTESSIYCLEYEKDEQIPYLVFWGREIILAFNKLRLQRISCWLKISYEERGNVFKDYMTEFFEIKKRNADGPLRAIAKLFGNSLYGKFGQQCMRTKQIISTEIIKKCGYEKLAEHIPKSAAIRTALQ